MGKIIRYCYKNRTRWCKNFSKKVFHKTGNATCKLIGIEIAEIIVDPKLLPGANWANVEEVVIPPEKEQKILKELWQVL